MKKIICFILAVIMITSLVACGSSTEVPTTPPDTVTQPVTNEVEHGSEENTSENENTMLMAEQLLMNNASTVVFDTLAEYEQKLHDLGFTEFKADLWRASPNSAPAMSPIELTFNESAFRLVFNYTSIDYTTNEEITVNNWVLYGTKADSALNISSFQAVDFELYDSVDISSANPSNTGFVHIVNYMMYNTENDLPVDFVSCEAYYYPDSRNLYNFVYKYENAMTGSHETPHVLATTEEDIDAVIDWDYYLDIEPPADAKPAAQMTIRCGDTDYLYYYEEGMTIADWAKNNNYDVDGWGVLSDGTCLSPDGMYIIEDINTPIEEIVDENGIIVAKYSPL